LSDLDPIVRALREARAVVVLTGAGISAESGIPTFRDAMDGMWAKFDPEELATPEAFARNPELVSKWYDERRVRCLSVKPNAGHEALARLEAWGEASAEKRRLTVITQNVDRLHHAAGSRNVIELHGNLVTWRCTSCGEEREERGGPFGAYPPRCACGGSRRPGVVWFGELLPEKALRDTYEALRACDLFMSVGTSAVVEPAAGFLHEVRARGCDTVEINRDPTPATRLVTWSVQGRAGAILPKLLETLFSA
jgi:NAD-dependent deacetylase